MIHHVMLSAGNVDDPVQFTEPSERMLKVEVIAGVAHLSIYRSQDGDMNHVNVEPEASVEVAAQSLIRALVIQIEDARGGLPDGWLPPGRVEPDDYEATHPHQHGRWSEGRRERLLRDRDGI